MPVYDQYQLLSIIDQASFAMDDVLLFLDTHPCDQAALNYYQYVSKIRQDAKEAYETNYGGALAAGKAYDTMIGAMREVIRLANAEGC